MKYLVFRNDRIGDFLITAPLLKAIKRNNQNSHISIVSSEKNHQFIKEINLVDKVFILNTKKKLIELDYSLSCGNMISILLLLQIKKIGQFFLVCF